MALTGPRIAAKRMRDRSSENVYKASSETAWLNSSISVNEKVTKSLKISENGTKLGITQ